MNLSRSIPPLACPRVRFQLLGVRLVAAFFLFAIVPLQAQVPQELLNNGGFEPPYNAVSGTNGGGTVGGNFPSGWNDNSRNQGKQVNNVYSEETTGTVSGSAFKTITTAGAGANPLPGVVINQVMNFIPNRTLSASIWIKASSATTVSMRFFLNSSPYTSRASRTCNVTTNWQQFTLNFTPTVAEVGRLEFNCTQAVTLWMDEASVTVANGGATVAVSPSGSDTTGDGSLGAPFQTIAKALSRVYPSDTVQLRGGTYRETITPTQSGVMGAPITITNYPGEVVVVTGADVIAGPWTDGGNGIYTAEVSWDLTGGRNNVFVDGVMAHEAREPNYGSGDLLHPATTSMTRDATNTNLITSATFSGKPENFYAGGRLHAGFHETWNWSAGTIGSSSGNAVTLSSSSTPIFTGVGAGYVYGLLGLLDADNEWFLQSSGSGPHTLSLRIAGQANPTGHLVEMRRRTYALDYNGRSYIVVRGLNLRCGDVRMNGSGNVLDRCVASHLSHFLTYSSGYSTTNGILISGAGHVVSNCTIHDTAGCGLLITGAGHLITRNTVYNTAYSGTYSAAIVVGSGGAGHTITFNTAHHSGRDILHIVTSNGGGHTISYNDFSEPGQMCKDLGVIYTYGNNAQGAVGGATRISHNWVYDNALGGASPLIYLDNFCRNYVVDHNVCWNATGDSGVRMNGPKDGHKVYHNTLFHCDDVDTRTFTLPFSHAGNPDPAFWNTSGTYSVDMRNNLFLGTTPDTQLTSSGTRDFRPKTGAAAIDSATPIAGFNDNYSDVAPDQGAYESGGAYWVPGVNGWSIDQPGSVSSAATEVSTTTATARGTLISAGNALTTVSLYWGESDGGTVPVAWANATVLGTAYAGNFQSLSPQLSGLTPNTTYWYRYRSTNAYGDTWSAPQSFTTLLPGVLDFSLSGDGVQTTSIGSGEDLANGIVVQTDGKIVVVGQTYNGANNDIAVIRYNADGSLDPTFGSGGKVITPIGGGDEEGRAVALQSDGRIVVAGYSHNGANYDFALVRYHADGSLDPTFGSTGIVTSHILGGDIAGAVAVQSDGKIVAAGQANNNGRFAIARYHPNGTLDTTFNTTGIVVRDVDSGVEGARSVVIQSDGKILAVGFARDFTSKHNVALLRYTSTGVADASFNGTGRVVTPVGSFSDEGYSSAIQPDGRILVAGISNSGALGNDFAVLRYNTDGTLDPSFGNLGKAIIDFFGNSDSGRAMALQRDGRIVVVGSSYSGAYYEMAVARLSPDGTLDRTFNGTGMVNVGVAGYEEAIAYGVALQGDGGIVAAGRAANGGVGDFALMRLLGGPNELLVNGGFESDEALGGGSAPGFGDWKRDQAATVTAENGIAPFEGTKMAKFLATNAAGADSGASSDVEQFVDLSAYAAEIAIGNLSVEMNARFNRVAGANSDTQFVVLLAARDGTIDNGNDLWASVEMLLADADPATWESLATSVPLPFGTTHLSVRVIAGENMVNNTVAPEFDGHYVDDVTLTVTIPPPDIQVEAPQGNIVTSGVPGVQFGLRQVGSGPDAGIRHRLTNTGLRPLTGIVATVTGHSADFLVAPPPATLGVGQSTEFDVVFTPTAAGARAATLSIASNDPDESPFLVLLAGTGLTVQEAWRQQYFGTVANAGNAADSADPDGDGHDNAFEFVAGLVPNDPASRFLLRVEPVAGQLGQKAIIFGPVVAGRTYGVKSKESLSDPEWTTLTNIAMSDNGSERTIADLEAGLGPKFYVIEITRP